MGWPVGRQRRVCASALIVCIGCLANGPAIARAGAGGAERTAVIIDPQDADSVTIGNHYVSVRGIPASNVVYLDLAAADYSEFATNQIPAFLGTLAVRGLDAQIDFIVVASSRVYRLPISGFISETISTCPVPVDHISLTSALATARFAGELLAGDAAGTFGLTSDTTNGYFAVDDTVAAFRGAAAWQGGQPSATPSARRYFIASMLGYTGPAGNTVAEIENMIDQSAAADGSQPSGTFYFIETNDLARSAPRAPFFDAATNSIDMLGGDAVHINGLLPPMGATVLGVMTGTNSWMAQPGDFTLVPGAFADHLTSFAAFFDTPQQTKISEWIRLGASGSHGAVEEPCAVAGKFPHPRMHVYYFQGLTLGESVYRSLGFVPFQTLVYGDPLTRPFAALPQVTLSNPPAGAVSGIVALEPMVSVMGGPSSIDRVEAYIDGVLAATAPEGQSVFVDTRLFPDGFHDLRLVAVGAGDAEVRGALVTVLETRNFNRSVSLDVEPASGDLTTTFVAKAIAGGAVVTQIRILENDRVIAVVDSPSGAVPVAGFQLGQGDVTCVAEAVYADGRTALSSPYALHVAAPTGACCLSDGTCLQHSQTGCDELGGAFSTNGASCDAVVCSICQTGDFNTDGSVALDDLGMFTACFSGTGVIPTDNPPGFAASCLCSFDFDGDMDVDDADTVMLNPMVSGPRPPNRGLVAYDYSVQIDSLNARIIDLPATDSAGEPLSYVLTQAPTDAAVVLTGAQALVQPFASAAPNTTNTLGFSVANSNGVSTNGSVTLQFGAEFGTRVTLSVTGVGEPSGMVSFSPADVSGKTQRMYPFSAAFAATNGTVQITAVDPLGVSPFERWVINGVPMPDGMNPVSAPLDRDIVAVAAYTPKRRLTVKSSILNTTMFISPDPDGVGLAGTPFTRDFLTSDSVTIFPLSAPGFLNWRLDGVDQPPGVSILVSDLTQNRVLAGIFSNVPADWDADGDVDLADGLAFDACFSGDVGTNGFVTPSSACLSAFDLDGVDGDVDLNDWAIVSAAMTGPF